MYPFDLEGHGLDRFAFEFTELADHVVKEMLTGLAAQKTMPELLLEGLEFVQESVDIMGGKIKRGDGEQLAFGPT